MRCDTGEYCEFSIATGCLEPRLRLLRGVTSHFGTLLRKLFPVELTEADEEVSEEEPKIKFVADHEVGTLETRK